MRGKNMKNNLQICDDCTSLKDEELKKCERCGEKFCPHNSSFVSESTCYHCSEDFKVEITKLNSKTRLYQYSGNYQLYREQKIHELINAPDGVERLTEIIEQLSKDLGMLLNARTDAQIKRQTDRRNAGGDTVRIPGVNGDGTKVLSSTIHSPEAIARKKVAAILKQMTGKEPTPEEITSGLQTLRAFIT
jgi:hypothetical protein